VTAAHKKRRRRIEFLDFMNDIVACARLFTPWALLFIFAAMR
jgi:hypothetical protein